MFAGVDVDEAVGLIAAGCGSVVAEVGRAAQRAENRCAAVKVVAAGRIHDARFTAVLAGEDDLLPAWGNVADKAALTEVATTFGVPAATARGWINLAGDLELLPRVRAAFLAGDLTLHRAKAIAVAIAPHPDGLREALESEALVWNSRVGVSTRELIARLDEACVALDPEQAARDREEFANQQDVRVRPDRHGHCDVSAFVTAQFGMELMARIDALMSTLCPGDPRTVGQRRVAALQSLVRGATTLSCHCGDDRCPSAMAREPGSAVAPAPTRTVVHVHTDAATLAGLHGQLVPTIAGHGPIDPALVRDLARDATWRGLFDDALSDIPTREACGANGFRRGRSRPAGLVRERHTVNTGHRPPSGPPSRPLVHHDAAYRYAPSDSLREWIVWVDGTCRFPGCDHPAEACDIDHVVPFAPDHEDSESADPARRGLTVRANLGALCRLHHHLKTAGLWTAIMHPDRSMSWTNTATGEQFITWPRHR